MSSSVLLWYQKKEETTSSFKKIWKLTRIDFLRTSIDITRITSNAFLELRYLASRVALESFYLRPTRYPCCAGNPVNRYV